MTIKVQLKREVNGVMQQVNPITSDDCVNLQNGEKLSEFVSSIENDEFSPTITQMSSVSKVGVGEDIDISDNTQEGYLKSAILSGNTLVNLSPFTNKIALSPSNISETKKVLQTLNQNTKYILIFNINNSTSSLASNYIMVRGYNTDGVGFCNSVLDAGFEIKGKKIMVLGAGGASRGVAVTLADYGASEIIIRNKTLSRAEIIANDINEHFPSCKASIGDMNITKEDIDAVNILINTTPLGMSKDKDKCAIDTNIVPDNKNLVVCDIVFNPHETKLLKWAKDNGLGVVYGIGMLIGQAIESYRIWTGIDIKESTANEIYESLKSNGRL